MVRQNRTHSPGARAQLRKTAARWASGCLAALAVRAEPGRICFKATIFLVLATSAFVFAQENAPVSRPGDLIALNLPDNVEMKVLIDYVSKRLGVNILYDEAIARKRVTIVAPERVPVESLLGLLQSALKMSGLALIDAEQPGWKKVVASQDLLAISSGISTAQQADGDLVATHVFQVRSATLPTVEQTIRPFLSKPGGNSFTVADANLLIVTDYVSNMSRIRQLIDLIDQPGQKASVDAVPVQYMDAIELARQVNQLLQEKGKIAGERSRPNVSLHADPRDSRIIIISTGDAAAEVVELIELLDVPTDCQTRTYFFRYVSPQRVDKAVRDLLGAQGISGKYTSVVDSESGMLFVRAPAAVHKDIADLSRQLDIAGADPESKHMRFYRLTNTTAAEVLATIQAMQTGDPTLAISAARPHAAVPSPYVGPNLPPAPPGEVPPPPPAYVPSEPPASQPAAEPTAPTGPVVAKLADATVTADTNTNMIIVVGPPPVQQMYKQLIDMLDKRRPQVMIEATLVTLDTSDGFSLGIELAKQIDCGDRQALIFSAFGLSKIDAATGVRSLIPGLGFNGILVGPDTAEVVIKALATHARAKVLSAPRVLVNDNATATLASIQEAPFTSINASDTVATTSFAGYASAGTTITVTPHISEGDHLQLSYTVTLNSFTGEGSSTVPPPRQTNELSSEITIPDGYAVIVGGLTRKDFQQSRAKLPWIGDIPVLGYLFSSQSRDMSQSTLFVFIRPVILRDDKFEDLKYLSDRDLMAAQLPPNFPNSQPQLIQ